MPEQIWTITAEIKAPFSLTADEQVLLSSEPPHAAIRNMCLDPVFNDKNEQTGDFVLTVSFVVDFQGEKPDSPAVADLGRIVLNDIVSLLSFLAGLEVQIKKAPAIKFNYPGTKKYRGVIFGSATRVISLLPLDSRALIAINLDETSGRILQWYTRGISDSDIVNSFLSLSIALEVLSNQFKCNEGDQRICKNCGNVEDIQPGMRSKVKSTCLRFGLKDDQIDNIWKTRNRVGHGGSSLSPEELRELQVVRNNMCLVILRGTKSLLGLSSSQLPKEEPPFWQFADPIIDEEWTEPEEKA